MLSKEKFIEKWKFHLAALALYGTTSDKNDGPFMRASKIWDIPAQAEGLLGQLHDSILSESPEKIAAWVVAQGSAYDGVAREVFQSTIRKAFALPEKKLAVEDHIEAIGKAFKAATEAEQKKLTDALRKIIAPGK